MRTAVLETTTNETVTIHKPHHIPADAITLSRVTKSRFELRDDSPVTKAIPPGETYAEMLARKWAGVYISGVGVSR